MFQVAKNKVLSQVPPSLRSLALFFRPYKFQLITVFFLGLLISGLQPLSVRLTQQVIDELPKGLNSPFFRWIPLALLGIFAASGFAKYFHQVIRRLISERVILELRSQIFHRYVHLPLSRLDQGKMGDFLSRLQNDLLQINIGLELVCDLMKEPFTFLGLIIVAAYCNWKLTAMSLLVAPLVAYLFSRTGAAVKRYAEKNVYQSSSMLSLAQETLFGSRVVKIFQMEDTVFRKFSEVQDQYFKTLSKSIRVQELATPLIEFIGAAVVAAVILYAGIEAGRGHLSPGQFVGFLVAIGLVQMPIKKLNNAYIKLKTAEAAAERVFEILEAPKHSAEVSAYRETIQKNVFLDKIEFKNIGMSYGPKKALKNISFDIKRGERVALVGPSGSGKTSIVSLLPRLYEWNEGEILMDGVDIRRIELNYLRSMMAAVTQEVILFNDSILENIRYGRPGATDEEILGAAEAANCMEFVTKHPYGIHERIGDRGVSLSGGEKQRLAIARALLSQAPILILDEATSNLDTQSENLVQSALQELMEGRTVLMVAHRLSTIRNADKILVIDRGTIQQQGKHSELSSTAGVYSDLWNAS